MGSITAHITGKVSPHYGVFLGGTYAPETSINSPVAMKRKQTEGRRGRFSIRGFLEEKSPERKERELNPSENLLCSSRSLPTFSLRVLVDRAELLYLPSEEEIPGRSRRSPGQRRTRFTLHRHLKNPALNKGRIQDSTSSLPCNRKTDLL